MDKNLVVTEFNNIVQKRDMYYNRWYYNDKNKETILVIQEISEDFLKTGVQNYIYHNLFVLKDNTLYQLFIFGKKKLGKKIYGDILFDTNLYKFILDDTLIINNNIYNLINYKLDKLYFIPKFFNNKIMDFDKNISINF